MGRIISKRQAANILTVSERTIYNYLKKGLLTPQFNGRGMGIEEDQVYRLRQVQGSLYPDKVMVSSLLARVQVLEDQVALLLRMMNIRHERLNLSDPEYLNLYRTADQLSNHGWVPHIEDQWADILCSIKLDDIDAMAKVTGDEHPWRPFLRLANSMYQYPFNKELRDQFSAAKANLTTQAYAYSGLKGQTAKQFSMLAERDTTPVKRLMRSLSKTRE